MAAARMVVPEFLTERRLVLNGAAPQFDVAKVQEIIKSRLGKSQPA
jgi:hypothetical protein